MDKQQIKEAAAKASEDYMENVLIMSGPRGSYRKGFIAGAEWRINSVWHDASEDPEREDEPILVEYQDWGFEGSDYTVCDDIFDYDARLKREGAYCTILRWAYINDLLPERKEETV